MQLHHYLTVLRRHWLALVLSGAFAGLLAILLTPRTAMYEAEAKIYVGTQSYDLASNSQDLSYERTLGLDRLISTFAVMIDSEAVADQAKLDVDKTPREIVAETTVAPIKDTQLLAVTVRDSDPVRARTVANGLADTFVEAVQRFEPPNQTSTEGEVPRLPASIFERARLPEEPLPTGLLVNVVLAVILGVATGAGVVLLIDYLDTTLQSPGATERLLGLRVIGVIPDFGTTIPTSRPRRGGRPKRSR